MTSSSIPGPGGPEQYARVPTRWTADFGSGLITPMRLPDPALLPKPLATLVQRYRDLAAAAKAANDEADELRRNRGNLLAEWQRERAAALAAGRKPPSGDQPLEKLDRRVAERRADYESHIAAGEILLREIGAAAGPLAAGEAARLSAEQIDRARRTAEAISDAAAAANDLADHDRLTEWWRRVADAPQRAPAWADGSALRGRLVGGLLQPAAHVVDDVIATAAATLEPRPEPGAGDQAEDQEPASG